MIKNYPNIYLKTKQRNYFKIKKASSDYPEEAFLFFFKFSSFFLGKKTTDASLSNIRAI